MKTKLGQGLIKAMQEAVTYQCKLCGVKKANLQKADNWEMQHLHLSADDDDEVVKFLTCDKCKNRSPMEFLAKVTSK